MTGAGPFPASVAARQSDGRIGSVHYDLVVPDFAKEPLSVSGILLSAATAGAVANALYRFDGVRRYQLPMKDSAAARGILGTRG